MSKMMMGWLVIIPTAFLGFERWHDILASFVS